ncbi:glycosyltransferase [Limnohabitans sp. Jir72]|uniref:glycosyltransferase n=1 Tax=Limnohabitans sp. Jir72 TaxID=1977909 RepID=UPI000D35F8FE|nr:glycosyltransferase [Limnohabitans sp. Jir72]PUE28096.1 hypothetical protein B9Z52_14570 [Limnohabitans sp. Jir72]
MKIIYIYHNILWAKYKASVFSKLYELSLINNEKIKFLQIAETEFDRSKLSGVDMSYHNYPFELLFKGAYGAIPRSKLIIKLFCSVWQKKADLILLPGFHSTEYWAMLLAAVLRGKKRAVFCDSTIYDHQQTFIKGLLKRIFFLFCDGFFVYGIRARSYVIHYGARPNKVFYRCQAAALPKDYSADLAFKKRMQHAPTSDATRFLYVGRLSHEKSLDILIHAFLKVRINLPDASLIIVGEGSQGQVLKNMVSSLGLTDAVLFSGSMDTLALAIEYAKASCLVLPSFSEPWGLVVNEALSYGCPVVVSNRCGCIPELVENQPTGFVFEAQNIDDLANKLLSVPAAFADVEKTARECIKLISNYNPSVAAEEILSGCKQILDSKLK